MGEITPQATPDQTLDQTLDLIINQNLDPTLDQIINQTLDQIIDQIIDPDETIKNPTLEQIINQTPAPTPDQILDQIIDQMNALQAKQYQDKSSKTLQHDFIKKVKNAFEYRSYEKILQEIQTKFTTGDDAKLIASCIRYATGKLYSIAGVNGLTMFRTEHHQTGYAELFKFYNEQSMRHIANEITLEDEKQYQKAKLFQLYIINKLSIVEQKADPKLPTLCQYMSANYEEYLAKQIENFGTLLEEQIVKNKSREVKEQKTQGTTIEKTKKPLEIPVQLTGSNNVLTKEPEITEEKANMVKLVDEIEGGIDKLIDKLIGEELIDKLNKTAEEVGGGSVSKEADGTEELKQSGNNNTFLYPQSSEKHSLERDFKSEISWIEGLVSETEEELVSETGETEEYINKLIDELNETAGGVGGVGGVGGESVSEKSADGTEISSGGKPQDNMITSLILANVPTDKTKIKTEEAIVNNKKNLNTENNEVKMISQSDTRKKVYKTPPKVLTTYNQDNLGTYFWDGEPQDNSLEVIQLLEQSLTDLDVVFERSSLISLPGSSRVQDFNDQGTQSQIGQEHPNIPFGSTQSTQDTKQKKEIQFKQIIQNGKDNYVSSKEGGRFFYSLLSRLVDSISSCFGGNKKQRKKFAMPITLNNSDIKSKVGLNLKAGEETGGFFSSFPSCFSIGKKSRIVPLIDVNNTNLQNVDVVRLNGSHNIKKL